MSGKEQPSPSFVPKTSVGFKSVTDSINSETDSDIDPLVSTRSTSDVHGSGSTGRAASFFFRGGLGENNLAPKKSQFLISPSPSTLTRNFGQRRKTILNTFQLSSKTKFNENDVYQLYQHTINEKGREM